MINPQKFLTFCSQNNNYTPSYLSLFKIIIYLILTKCRKTYEMV